MGIFGRKRKTSGDVDAQAAKAIQAGQALYIRKIHLVPGDDGRRLATALSRIEAAGYRMENQEYGGQGLQKHVTATFRAVPPGV
ncbi:hypothetical protein [Kitasatospora sp. NPDC050543]|uniref:hypothetical protein n=1 Tax=Kitasatospora sp. NPDC050543 TaxID=3364054 RepID=UPI0037B20A25